MKPTCIILLCMILVLTACTPSGGELPLDEALQKEESPVSESLPEGISVVETPPENQIATITPTNGGRIREQKSKNDDVIGWLTVPGTEIDNVILHSSEKENGFYTNHDFNGNPSKDGAYFADKRCDFTSPTREGISQNIALYGHSWDENPDGTLFSQIKRFKDPAFAETHPYIFFSTEEDDLVWEIFAVYHITVDQPYIIPDLSWASLSEVLNIAYEASLYDYGIRPTKSDKILTVTTCSFDVPGKPMLPFDTIPDYRLVVMARLVSPEDPCKETADISINDNPMSPDVMPVIYSHYADVVQFNGILYDNFAKSYSDEIPVINTASLVPVGEVSRSGVMRDLQDFDSTKLPEGTPLYYLDGYDNLLVAKDGEEIIVYGYKTE